MSGSPSVDISTFFPTKGATVSAQDGKVSEQALEGLFAAVDAGKKAPTSPSDSALDPTSFINSMPSPSSAAASAGKDQPKSPSAPVSNPKSPVGDHITKEDSKAVFAGLGFDATPAPPKDKDPKATGDLGLL